MGIGERCWCGEEIVLPAGAMSQGAVQDIRTDFFGTFSFTVHA